jgi:alcohol dehydrogenase class IV
MLGACRHAFTASLDGDACFSLDASSLVFGRGAIREVGDHAAALGMRRVALFTDPRVGALEFFDHARRSLRERGLDVVIYDEVRVEPTDGSFEAAARFAQGGRFDGYVSVGGGSVIDTCKAAALLAAYPAPLLAYTNAPLGEGRPVPGPLPPHIACPTTCGTGSECTGIAVFDLVARQAKTGVASRRLRPSLAVVDPDAARTLPPTVVASSGFDVLCHALESYTARPSRSRPRPAAPSLRPMSQGRNPWSDLGSLEALRLGGRVLERAVRDASDEEAREQLCWAATLAGIAFGNAGVHLPHAMSYAVAGMARDFCLEGYPAGEPLIPHGLSVVLGAPSVFRGISAACPGRCLEAAGALGVDLRSADERDAGEAIAGALLRLMRATGLPACLGEVGYGPGDVDGLAERALEQQRLVQNAPCPVDLDAMRTLFAGALEG